MKKKICSAALMLLATVAMAHPLDGEYQLQSIRSGGKTLKVQLKRAPTLTIEGERAFGFGGCNRFNANVTDAPLRFGDVAATRMACLDDKASQIERQFFQLLPQGVKVRQDRRGGFVLLAENGDGLQLKKLPVVQEKTIWIGGERQPCSRGAGKFECWQYRETPDGAWLNLYDPIEGFDWQPGHAYKLKVREERIKNPPADASNIKRTLVEVLETE